MKKAKKKDTPIQLNMTFEEAMKKAVAAGAKYHKVDKSPWQKAMTPIYNIWASKVGGMEMIKAVQETP